MLQSYTTQTAFTENTSKSVSLQLLLFVDDRNSSKNKIEEIQNYLKQLKAQNHFDLEVIEIAKQPHLVEYFKLVATPSLVKISPSPRHILAGSDLIAQLKKWWPRWQTYLEKQQENQKEADKSLANNKSVVKSENYSGDLIKLSDEIFRLKQEKEELLEQLKFKDQILAMLAHDLRSPLTAASIAVETLEMAENAPPNHNTSGLKDQLYSQTRRQFRIMNRMITDLLQASKQMSSQLHLQPEPLQLHSLCQEILSQLAHRFKQKNQSIQTDIPGDLPLVYADGELIRQVIVNLLDNAIKYTPSQGHINLSIIHKTTQKIQVSIYDNGPGIPEEKKERIFEGHFRLKRDESKEGYGLGLCLCRKIIREHCGQIWVESSYGHGSSFHFTLPVH